MVAIGLMQGEQAPLGERGEDGLDAPAHPSTPSPAREPRATRQPFGSVRESIRAALDHPRAELVRRVMVPLAAAVGIVLFGAVVNRHYPLRDWLFFRYLKIWLLTAYWAVGCVASGHAIVSRVAPRWRMSERLLVASATGVFAFFVLMFVGGILHLFRFGWFGALLPALMLASGARSLGAHIKSAARHLAAARRRPRTRPGVLAGVLLAFGTIYLFLLYLNILTPDNASFDAVYYHLGIAQQHAALGGIERTPEGWVVDGLPALAATIYAWGFIFPGNDLFDALMVCAHLELLCFMVTLAGLPVLVRALVPRSRPWGAWTALFLFPSIWVYDAGLHSGNDHIAAFWAVPIWLSCRRTWAALEPRYASMFAVCAAGAVMTKYQAAALVGAPALALLARALWVGVRARSIEPARALGAALGVGLAVTAPLWLKNWLWYGDPLFPALYKHLALRPFHPHAMQTLATASDTLLQPQGTTLQKLGKMLRASVQLPFRTHERPDFHKDWPIFGPMFHLSLFWLPFLRRTQRIWALVGATFLGLFYWYLLTHHERYLQPLVPWMAAVAAASLLLAWQQRGLLARGALSALLLLEVVWGADSYFFSHMMLRDAPIRATAQWISTGFRGELDERKHFSEPLKSIGEGLPAGARVLLHEHNPRIGLSAPVVMDMPQYQTGISYQDLGSPRAVYDLYRSLGVTHVVYQHGFAMPVDNLAGNLRFWQFSSNYTVAPKRYDAFTVAEMPSEPPAADARDRVLYLGCDPAFTRGLHRIKALGSDGEHPVQAEEALPGGKAALLRQAALADLLVSDGQCKEIKVPDVVFDAFTKAARRGSEDLWVRKLDTY